MRWPLAASLTVIFCRPTNQAAATGISVSWRSSDNCDGHSRGQGLRSFKESDCYRSMRSFLTKFGAILAYVATLALCVYLTFTLTRSTLVPFPVRMFQSDPGAFRDCFDLISRNETQGRVTATLASHGVSHIRIDHDYVFFIFKGLPPDAIEVIGRPLRQDQHPWTLPGHYINRNTFRFERLDHEWFYWQFEPWGEVRKVE